jgi:FHA domain-containing protein
MPTCPAGHDSTDPDFCDVCGMRIGGAAPAPAQPDPGSGVSAPAPGPASASAGPGAPAEPCPQCGTIRSGQFCETCGYDFASGKPTVSPAGSAAAAGPAAPAAPAAGPPAPAATLTGPGQPGPAEPAPAPGPAAALGGNGASGDVGTGPVAGGPPGSRAPVWTAVVTADRAYYDSVIAEGGPDAASIEFPGYCPERRFRLSGQEMRIGRRSASRGLEPEIDLTGPPTDPGVSHLHAVLIAESDGSWALLDPGSANGTIVNGGEIPGGVRVPLHDGDRICVGAWTVLTIRATTS